MRLLRGWTALLARSAQLRQACVGAGLTAFGLLGLPSVLVSFTIGVYDWQQTGILQAAAISVLPGVVGYALVFNCLLPRYGAHVVLLLTWPLLALGSLVLCFAPWSAAAIFGTFCCWALSLPFYPCYILVVTSSIFTPAEWAQAQGIVEMVVALSAAISMPTFSQLYEAEARGWRAAIPFVIGAAAVVPGVLIIVQLVWSDRKARKKAAGTSGELKISSSMSTPDSSAAH